MDNEKIQLCLEAKDDQGSSVYLIYSAHFKVSELKGTQLKDKSCGPPLHFIREAVITGGAPSMGCGVYGSKLVFAGGLVKEQNGCDEKCKGVITYDRTTKKVSHDYIPVMRGGKFKPLLFQLNDNLYALDTSLLPDSQSFEVYIPNHKHWHPILPLQRFTYGYYVGQLPESEGFNFFSWFVFGYCLCISSPKDTEAFSHHAKYDSLFSCDDKPLPFPGMAITYCQHGFQDVVLITFSKQGLVEGRLLHFNHHHDLTSVFHKPVLIFDTKTHFQHDGVLTGCFAEFGNGTFSLTTFDTDNVYVYIFKVSRRRCKNDDDLNLKLLKISTYSYKYTDFSEAGYTSLSIAGCFAPSPGWSKERTEAEIYHSHFPLYDEGEQHYDTLPCLECAYFSHMDATDNADTFVLPCRPLS